MTAAHLAARAPFRQPEPHGGIRGQILGKLGSGHQVFSSRFIPVSVALGATALLAACEQNAGADTQLPGSAQSRVLSPALMAIYERSCKNCHSVPPSGAPQTNDARAWAPRVTQGAELLLDHTFNGYKGMPPMGACMDCNENQYRLLIEYMSGTKLK